jgi:hypothetical protein
VSQKFPTHKQFKDQIRAELKAEYPEVAKQQPDLLEDTVALQTDEGAWLRHLGNLIRKGVPAEQPVLDTLHPRQLDALRSVYAPFESLTWYIPARFRTHKGLEPLASASPR